MTATLPGLKSTSSGPISERTKPSDLSCTPPAGPATFSITRFSQVAGSHHQIRIAAELLGAGCLECVPNRSITSASRGCAVPEGLRDIARRVMWLALTGDFCHSHLAWLFRQYLGTQSHGGTCSKSCTLNFSRRASSGSSSRRHALHKSKNPDS